MRIYDVCVFSVCILVVMLLGFVAGCNRTQMMHTRKATNMPCLEMDFSPPEVPARGLIRNRAVRPPVGRGKWAAADERAWRYIVIHHSATESGNAAGHKSHWCQ